MLTFTHSTSTLSAQAEIADIDAQIAELEAKLAQLWRRRNALIPLSKILPELIAKILVHLVDDLVSRVKENAEQGFQTVKRFLDWTPATHFCNSWRDVGLNHSRLWTWIAMANAMWFKTFLEREELIRLTASNMGNSIFAPPLYGSRDVRSAISRDSGASTRNSVAFGRHLPW
ncbi:hypothetical protein AX16_010217 [Volvariella volvacea WC 439]|nr:hypothetical protein AX16_010217 [Volvariella volvacea WC 439]